VHIRAYVHACTRGSLNPYNPGNVLDQQRRAAERDQVVLV